MNNMINNYLKLLRKLDPQQKPLWGKMTPQHMVEHLILSVQMSNSKLRLECYNPPEKIPSLHKFLMSDRPLPKLFVNPAIGENLNPLEYSSYEQALQKLRSEVADHIIFFKNNPYANPVNVTFGNLNEKEWEVFHRKHFTHHLSQFGLI